MRIHRVCAVLPLFALAFSGMAQNAPTSWPAKQVSVIVGFPAGSGTDNAARFLVEGLRQRTGQPFIVSNRPGAIGNIAALAVARSPADGYTMLFTPNSTHSANIHLFRNLPFDPVKDFSPVTTILTLPFLMLVNPTVTPVNSVAELTQFIKANPGKVMYGSGSATGRVAAELYRSMAGVEALNVPYNGTPPAIVDLLGGRLNFVFADVGSGLPFARSGKARALAVTSSKRTTLAPDLPTMGESGLSGNYDLVSWMAVFLPANAPKDIVQKLADLCNAVITNENARESFRKLGAEPYPGSPETLARLVDSETAKWGRIVKGAGIEPE